jgi:hypothetical protein
MSSISDAVSALNTSLNAMVPALANAVNRKVAQAALADNALALNGQSATQMISTAAAHTDAHAALTNNPHQVTYDEVGAYSKASIDSLIASLIPSGILPLSTFGKVDGSAIPVSVTVNGNTCSVSFSANIPAIMAGQAFSLPAQVLNYPSPNVTMLIYLQLIGGVPSYMYSTVAQPETSTMMYLGTVTTNGSGQVVQNTIGHVVRIDNYRISTLSAGGAIPVSGGTPDQTGQHLLWQ